jgi:hypothetical protein
MKVGTSQAEMIDRRNRKPPVALSSKTSQIQGEAYEIHKNNTSSEQGLKKSQTMIPRSLLSLPAKNEAS